MTTPAIASEPYSAEAPSFRISTRSTMPIGNEETSTNDFWPSSASGYDAMRWPSTSTSVASTDMPRSDTPLAPPAIAPLNACVSVPLLSAAAERITSAIELRPLLAISSALMTVTGDAVSASVRRMNEPVTMTDSSVSAGIAPRTGPASAALASGAIAAPRSVPIAAASQRDFAVGTA